MLLLHAWSMKHLIIISKRETSNNPFNAMVINSGLHNILPPDSGRYHCVAGNKHGKAYSDYATFTVEGKHYF